MKKSIKEQEMSLSIQASDFINKLEQDLGFGTMGGDEVAELLLRGNKMPDTYKKEGLYIGIGKYEEDGKEGLWPITIAFRFGKGNSPWKSASEEMKNELLNKRDNIIDRNYDIDVMDYSKRKMDEMVLRMNDAVIPSTAFFDFLKKYVEKFEGLIGTQTVQENKNSKVIKLTENDLMNIVQKVIEEQQGEDKTQQCQRFAKKRESLKAKGDRIIRLAPKKIQGMITSIFNKGLEGGPESFKNAIPQNIKAEFQKKIATLKKPKSDSELESMVSNVENEIQNIQEQWAPQSPWVMGSIIILSVLLFLVLIIWGMEEPDYCMGRI